MKLETLTVYREKKGSYNMVTTLKDSNGKVKAVFGNMLRQPKKNSKTIVINCFTYALDWSNVQEKKYYIKVKDRLQIK